MFSLYHAGGNVIARQFRVVSYVSAFSGWFWAEPAGWA